MMARKEWINEARASSASHPGGLLERLRAAQSPSRPVARGWEKVYEVLMRPGVLESFLAPSEGAELVRESFVRMCGAR